MVGLYLSKYDLEGLKSLGFDSFLEAFNAMGYALGAKPASIKNYRDEFDPVFPNLRKGWHKRQIRANCLKVLEEYKDLDMELFTDLIESLVGYDRNAWSEVQVVDEQGDSDSQFAKRLITGLAAESISNRSTPPFLNSKAGNSRTQHASDAGTTFVCGSARKKTF